MARGATAGTRAAVRARNRSLDAHRRARRPRCRHRDRLPACRRFRPAGGTRHARLRRAERGGLAAAGHDGGEPGRARTQGAAECGLHVRLGTGRSDGRRWCRRRHRGAGMAGVRAERGDLAHRWLLRALSQPCGAAPALAPAARVAEARRADRLRDAVRGDEFHVHGDTDRAARRHRGGPGPSRGAACAWPPRLPWRPPARYGCCASPSSAGTRATPPSRRLRFPCWRWRSRFTSPTRSRAPAALCSVATARRCGRW